MDARVDPAAHLGIKEGDAHVIRNAGGIAADAIRSIVVSQRLLGTREIALFHHTDCGMLTFKTEQLRDIVKSAAPGDQKVASLVDGLHFHEFDDVKAAVQKDVQLLREHPLILKETKITGWVYEVETGKNPGWGNVPETLDKVKEFYDVDELRHALPVPGAADGLNALAEMGFSLIIVTARNMAQEAESTERWLEKHFDGIFDCVVFSSQPEERIDKGGRYIGTTMKKLQVCMVLEAQLLIDDLIETALHFGREARKPVLLFGDYEWNKRVNTSEQWGFQEKLEAESGREWWKEEVVELKPEDMIKRVQARVAQLAKTYSAHRPVVQRVLTTGFIFYVLGTTYRSLSASASSSSSSFKKGKGRANERNARRPQRVAVDAIFYERLSAILRIVIPSLRSKEALLLFMHSSLLIFRTAISLYVAALDGKIVASLVRAETLPFLLNILRWLLVAIPATWTNSWLSYVQNKLAIAYRTRLTKEVLKEYLGDDEYDATDKVYYKLGESESNLDDRIKNPDQMITHDIHRFSTHLAAIYANMAKPVLDVILYNYQLSQNVGAEGLVLLTVLVQLSASLLRRLTPPFGMYTALSAQLSGSLRHTHSRLAEFAEEIAFFRWRRDRKIIGGARVCWSCQARKPSLEGTLVARLCGRGDCEMAVGELRDAFGRVMYSYKDLAELAGYTARVSMLLETMKDAKKGHFEKALVSSASTKENAKILQGRGQVIESEEIRFEGVPIVTPNGDILVKSLTFYVKPGQHLLIVGPNGCGKSSLFRILGGLWPVYGHVTDDDLLRILSIVQMDNIVEREGGWDIAKEWRDALSGGDKQKIAWARLFYHKPKYAVLDEATSLVPIVVEGMMMDHATELGITLLTVSHRPSLWKYHAMILHYDGQGGYVLHVFTKLDAEKRLALQEEKQALEAKLLEVPKMKMRLAELLAVAGEQ
ncbi:hypothetical protein EW146_g462 [Bondarzewia mesenterica]|uniref:ABC transporter domain-containing protein n=1 Tax=Bondarzewia mesenterica TaxID=1095465 RepID=A0A4S4M7C8_9AGAM|nr:hypothetical protein EW146_g462 [Bondarzewia mesenterica]